MALWSRQGWRHLWRHLEKKGTEEKRWSTKQCVWVCVCVSAVLALAHVCLHFKIVHTSQLDRRGRDPSPTAQLHELIPIRDSTILQRVEEEPRIVARTEDDLELLIFVCLCGSSKYTPTTPYTIVSTNIDFLYLNVPCPAKNYAIQQKHSLEFSVLLAEKVRGRTSYAVIQSSKCKPDHLIEETNIVVDSLVRGEDQVSERTTRRFALQDKRRLHTILSQQFGAYLPIRYGNVPDKYPAVLKITRGHYGTGIAIVTSDAELKRQLKGKHRHRGNNHQQYIIEEALVNATEHVMHYFRTPPTFPGQGWIKVWCGAYSKDGWTRSGGLYVKGRVDEKRNTTSSHVLQKGECDPSVLHVILGTLKTEDISGMGCVNFKYDGVHPKIFDWNLRHCGSMNSPQRLKQLLYSKAVEIYPNNLAPLETTSGKDTTETMSLTNDSLRVAVVGTNNVVSGGDHD